MGLGFNQPIDFQADSFIIGISLEMTYLLATIRLKM